MRLTLQELLTKEYYQDFNVLCGAGGLGNVVRSATVMDAIDIENWLQGGEILLSSGYIWKDSPQAFAVMIERVSAAGAAGLFIKLGRFMDSLPPQAVEAAERLRFPIVQMPKHMLFLDVLEPVLSSIINSQAEELRYSQQTRKAFIDLMIRGGGISEILQTLRDFCGREVLFYDAVFELLHSPQLPPQSAKGQESLWHTRETYPARMDGRFLGYLINLGPAPFDQVDLTAVEHAVTSIILTLQKNLSNAKVEERYRDNFVQDLVNNNIKSREEVLRRGRVFGWDLSGNGYVSIIVDIDDFKKQYLRMSSKSDSHTINEVMANIGSFCRNFLRQYYSGCISTLFSDSTAFLLPIQHSQEEFCCLLSVCEVLREQIAKQFRFTVTVGVGEPQESIMLAHLSFQQAKRSVALSRRTHVRDHVMAYRDLGIYQFLDQLRQSGEMRASLLRPIRTLERYDDLHHTQLLDTLVQIAEHQWNLRQTAQGMYAHYNTVKSRYKKICEVLETDLSSMEQRLQMDLAVKLHLITCLEP